MRIKVNLPQHSAWWIGVAWLACAFTVSAQSSPCTRSWTLRATYPHNASHFTQGLVLHAGRLFESNGLYGQSAVHEVELSSGQTLRTRTLPSSVFGEGLAVIGQQLLQLSWREQTAWRYDLDLRLVRTHRYRGEGWGLATLPTAQGERLILSDGTPVLRVLHPDTLEEESRIPVTYEGRPLKWLNELEVINGEILANVWHADEVAAIDPASGVVRALYNFSALRSRLVWPRGQRPQESDLNGLAWDADRSRLLVTGKRWPQLFEVEIGSCPDVGQ